MNMRRQPPVRARELGEQSVTRSLQGKVIYLGKPPRSNGIAVFAISVAHSIDVLAYAARVSVVRFVRRLRGVCAYCGSHPRILSGGIEFCDCRTRLAK
jgi:hypothetical protein